MDMAKMCIKRENMLDIRMGSFEETKVGQITKRMIRTANSRHQDNIHNLRYFIVARKPFNSLTD